MQSRYEGIIKAYRRAKTSSEEGYIYIYETSQKKSEKGVGKKIGRKFEGSE